MLSIERIFVACLARRHYSTTGSDDAGRPAVETQAHVGGKSSIACVARVQLQLPYADFLLDDAIGIRLDCHSLRSVPYCKSTRLARCQASPICLSVIIPPSSELLDSRQSHSALSRKCRPFRYGLACRTVFQAQRHSISAAAVRQRLSPHTGSAIASADRTTWVCAFAIAALRFVQCIPKHKNCRRP